MTDDRTVGRSIPMLDLAKQHASIEDELREAVLGPLSDGRLLSSEPITPFEAALAAYCQRDHAVGVASGTAALHIALIAANVGPNDEVVTVPNSFFATTEAILEVGARPVFVDVDETHLLDTTKLAASITEQTRAIVPVHLYGNVADVDGIHRVLDDSRRRDIAVIEDCAHAMGAGRSSRPVPLGGVGAFSFNPTKNIGALGDAGAVVTSDPVIAETARLLRDHGRVRKNVHARTGFNSRLSRINDRVLAVKLRHLDRWNARRRDVAARYGAAFAHLPNLAVIPMPEDMHPVYHQYVIITGDRDGLRHHLHTSGIRSAVHYPTLIPDQPALADHPARRAVIPTARALNHGLLSLPCYPELTDEQVEQVIETVGEFCSSSSQRHFATVSNDD